MARENATSETDGAALWNIAAGLDRSVVPTRINDLGLADAYDVVIVDGVIKPRPGVRPTSRFVGYPSQPTRMPVMFYNIRDRTTQLDTPLMVYMHPSDDTLAFYRWNGTAWVAAGTAAGSSGLDSLPQATAFKDATLITYGYGAPGVWNPSTFVFDDVRVLQADTDLKAPEHCKYIESSGSRVFLANGAPYTNRVWWSDTGDYKVYSNGTGKPERGTASFEDLGQGEFGTYEITAMKMHMSMQLLVWKAWGIWKATWAGDIVTWTFIPGTNKIGTIANRTVQQWRDRIIFFGTDRNIYAVDANANVAPIGNKVQRYIDSIINREYANRSFAIIDPVENLYYLFIPVGAEQFPRHLIILNLETGAFTEGRLDILVPVTSGYTYYPGYLDAPGMFLTQAVVDADLGEFNYTLPLQDLFVNFAPYIWSKVYDYNEMYQGVAETGEIHKIALHGIRGRATARARTAQGLYELANAVSPDLLSFGEIDVTANLAHYVSERTQAARFAQWGVVWTAGDTLPLHLQGATIYGLPRMGSERGGG